MSTTTESAVALVRRVCDKSVLFNEPSPFSAAVEVGAPALVVVTGENASGKSLFVRVLAAIAQQDHHGLLPVAVSIRERTGGGASEMGGLRRAFMFGDETEQSTGATSVGTVHTAFRNLDRPNGSMLILDEPEIGLSDGYAGALGELIGQLSGSVPKCCVGVVVVTHSRTLVRGLVRGAGVFPTHVLVSAEQARAGLEDWLTQDEERSVDELLALRDVGLDRWRRVNTILKGH